MLSGSDRKHLREGREKIVCYQVLEFWLGNTCEIIYIEECLRQVFILCHLNLLTLPELLESVHGFVLLDYSWFICPVRFQCPPLRPFLFENYLHLDSNHTLRVESANNDGPPPLDIVTQIKADWSACPRNFWGRTKGVDEYSLMVEALGWGAWKLLVATMWESASSSDGGWNWTRVHKSQGESWSSSSLGLSCIKSQCLLSFGYMKIP